MYLFVEACVLLLLTMLYWLNRERRRFLHGRIGTVSFKNVWHVARNISYMLCRRPVYLYDESTSLRRGCILYSIHYGLWELLPTILSHGGYDVGVLVNRYAEEKDTVTARLFDNMLTRYRSNSSVEVFDRHDALGIVRFLKQGGILGVLVDGCNRYSKLTKIEKLARVSNVPLIPFAAYRKNGYGVVHIGCDLDRLMQRNPMEYMWFYRSRTV